MPNIITPDKKKLTIMALVLLFLSVCSAVILFNINRSLRSQVESNATVNPVNRVIVDFDKPFTIQLSANPSTGYQWQADFDTELIKLENVDFRQKNTKDKVGVEEVQVFVFKSLKKEATSINFRYVKPWEVDTQPSDTKEFEVVYN
jgi:predicted secreted protein